MPGALLWGYYLTDKKWIPLQVDTNGYVKVDLTNIKLNDLADVSVATPADDDLFYYDDATGLWKSRKLVAGDIPNLAASKITSGILNPARVGPKIQDADADTYWWVEKTADEDKIHGVVKGVEAFLLENDGILTLAKQSRFQAHKDANTQTIGDLEEKITFETEVYDEQGEFDNATNFRFTAKKAGYYLVLAFVTFDDPQDQDRFYVSLKKNTSTYLSTYWASHGSTSSPAYISMAPFSVAPLAVDDYVEVFARSWDGDRTIASLTNAQFFGHKLS